MQILNDHELMNILGGETVSREEFCKQLKELMESGDLEDPAFDGAAIAYAKECIGVH